MANKKKHPAPPPEALPEAVFVRSPLPTPEQHAALAAQLLAPLGKGGEIPNAAILDAVANAARLWTAVLMHPTEETVERARFDMAPHHKRDEAERRWRDWLDSKRTAEEVAGDKKDMIDRANSRSRADVAFKKLAFPAAFDDVLAAIDNDGSIIGRAKLCRRNRFRELWLSWATGIAREQWERVFNSPRCIPSEGDVLAAEAQKRAEHQKAGLAPKSADYEGKGGRKRLAEDVARARRQHEAKGKDDWTARLRELEEAFDRFKDESIDKQLATEFFRIFKDGVQKEGRSKGGKARQDQLDAERAEKNQPG
jgi:hypothetical protein